jgi:hypothetical protein
MVMKLKLINFLMIIIPALGYCDHVSYNEFPKEVVDKVKVIEDSNRKIDSLRFEIMKEKNKQYILKRIIISKLSKLKDKVWIKSILDGSNVYKPKKHYTGGGPFTKIRESLLLNIRGVIYAEGEENTSSIKYYIIEDGKKIYIRYTVNSII